MEEMKRPRLLVIGGGRLGQHHTRILAGMPSVELVGICDINQKVVAELSRKYQIAGYTDYQIAWDKVRPDAVIIATPTPTHYEIARFFLGNQVHCLVEKPLTTEVQQADELISLSHQGNLILQVGHVERFNSAVLAAEEFIHQPKFIEVNRLGPFSERMDMVGVVLDLMIHDIDIVLHLLRSVNPADRVISLEAIGARVLTETEDIAKVRLKFSSGCWVDLSASRISLEKYRHIRIFQPDSYISIDYAGPALKIYRKKKPRIEKLSDIEIIRPRLPKEEPLAKELQSFVNCLITGQEPLVKGEHGRNALELAQEILRQLNV